jgi:hypothetical protein
VGEFGNLWRLGYGEAILENDYAMSKLALDMAILFGKRIGFIYIA